MQIKLTKNIVCLSLFIGLMAAAAGSAALAANNSPLTTPTDPEQSTTMPQRIAQRQSAFKVQLSATQLQGIKAKCSVAQTGMQDLKTKDAAAANTRHQVYSDLAVQLANIIDHLKRQSLDTTQVVAAQKPFNDAIDIYLTDALSYKTAMDDSVVMDCKADPTGFEASLLASRQSRAQLANDVAKIKAARPALIKALNDAQQALIKDNQKAAQ